MSLFISIPDIIAELVSAYDLANQKNPRMSRQVPKSLLLRQARRISPESAVETPTLSSLLTQFTVFDQTEDQPTLVEQYGQLEPLLQDITLQNPPFDSWTSAQINTLKHHLDTRAVLPWHGLSLQDKRAWYLLGYGSWGPRKGFDVLHPNDIQWDKPAHLSTNLSSSVSKVSTIPLCSKDRIEWEKNKRRLDPLTLSVGLFASVISLFALVL